MAKRIEYITNNSKDIELTKPEVVRIILHAFFKSQKDKDFEKVRELGIKIREGSYRLAQAKILVIIRRYVITID